LSTNSSFISTSSTFEPTTKTTKIKTHTIRHTKSRLLKGLIDNHLIQDLNPANEIGNTLIFDDWKNAGFQEILGSVLITSKGKVLV
ncbi:92_t:CDS:2, partial [Cetraspora pellucida]